MWELHGVFVDPLQAGDEEDGGGGNGGLVDGDFEVHEGGNEEVDEEGKEDEDGEGSEFPGDVNDFDMF